MLNNIIYVFLISMLPIVELRGAIPVGAALGLPFHVNYIVCVVGNMLPVPFILLFAKNVLVWLSKIKKIGPFFQWMIDKGAKVAEKFGPYGYLSVFLFVAIPLPGTGAWTASLAVTLLQMKMRPAILSILGGVLAAGLIMSAASYGVVEALGHILS